MCVLFLAYRAVAEFPLVLAMNRDEFFGRPTAPAAFWPAEQGIPADEILAGRDLEAGGTWLGVTRHGRFAAISNFRDPRKPRRQVRSRGEIVTRFLAGTTAPMTFLSELKDRASEYNDFNLICGSFAGTEEVAYLSSRSGELKRLGPGIYGLSNAFLDTPWPKVVAGKAAFEKVLRKDRPPGSRAEMAEDSFAFLRDTRCPPDEALPDTGLGLAGERALSPLFIEPVLFSAGGKYGTVSSTALILDSTGTVYFEQRASSEFESAPIKYQFGQLD